MDNKSVIEESLKRILELDEQTEQELTIAAIKEHKTIEQKTVEIINYMRKHPKELAQICSKGKI